jgi:hypothetical protein
MSILRFGLSSSRLHAFRKGEELAQRPRHRAARAGENSGSEGQTVANNGPA